MKCENNFCIYESKGRCLLTDISINEMGICNECIYPDIGDNLLEIKKQETRIYLDPDSNI